jgi:uncharacterized protein YjiS (DUF1127 family)
MAMSKVLSASGGIHAITRPARPPWLVPALKGWWAAYRRRRSERLAVERLRGMSERELKDIGIVRPQIEFAVRHGDERYRRVDLGL